MNKIDELIQQLCPDGVEYKAVKDCFSTESAPKKIKRQDYREKGLYPIVDQSQQFIAGFTDDESALFDATPKIAFGDHTCTLKYIDFQFAQGADGLKVLCPKQFINARYAYYGLCNLNIQSSGYSRHWSVLTKHSIPVPPLEVQQEIVLILDAYSDLEQRIEANLQRELAARKQQYEHYRDELLSFEDDVPSYCLSALAAKIVDGSHKAPPVSNSGKTRLMFSAANIENGFLDCSFGRSISEIDYLNEAARVKTQRGDVLLTIVGAIGRTAIVETNEALAFQRSVCVITPDQNMVGSAYLRYLLGSTPIQSFMQANASGAAQKGFYLKQVGNLRIQVPPIEAQQEIVAKLDALSEQQRLIESNLLRELDARKKQYEHYRDRLLDLPRKES